ncbi:recombinase family protein [Azospirillum sp. 412522]|nr:recombinase family protein [Azospirillum sp. 412522]
MPRPVDAGGADIVFAGALDRLTRDPEESHALFKRLKHRGVRLVTLAEGEVSNIHVAVSGISNALYLEAVAFKTWCSILDKVRKGEIITGLAYGYRVVKVHAEDGTLVDRHWEIVAEQAAVIREIFAAFASGHSRKQIARHLNDRGVPGPRGGIWRDTTSGRAASCATRSTQACRCSTARASAATRLMMPSASPASMTSPIGCAWRRRSGLWKRHWPPLPRHRYPCPTLWRPFIGSGSPSWRRYWRTRTTGLKRAIACAR